MSRRCYRLCRTYDGLRVHAMLRHGVELRSSAQAVADGNAVRLPPVIHCCPVHTYLIIIICYFSFFFFFFCEQN